MIDSGALANVCSTSFGKSAIQETGNEIRHRCADGNHAKDIANRSSG